MPSEYVPPQQLTPNGPVHGGFVFHEEPSQVNRDPLFVGIQALNAWLDGAQLERDTSDDPELTQGEDSLMRVLKVTEEAGEVAAAYIGWTGQNPRKGVTHDLSDVISELCDVALTALAAVEHFTAGGRMCTETLFREHVEKVRQRSQQ